MIKYKFIDIYNEDSTIYLVGRNERGVKRTFVIKDFKPYFFVEESEKIRYSNNIVAVVSGEYRSVFGEKLKKVIVNSPSDVPKLRERFTKTYESKIPFTQRFRYDKRIRFWFYVVDDSKDEISHKEVFGE